MTTASKMKSAFATGLFFLFFGFLFVRDGPLIGLLFIHIGAILVLVSFWWLLISSAISAGIKGANNE